MNLRQHFYSLSHDPTIGVIPFTNQVLTVVRQLESIKRKPQIDEITDKLLIGLDPSFTAVRTNLALCNPEPSIKEITAALKEFEENETLRPAYSAPNDLIKQETLLYANKTGCHGSGGGGFRSKFGDFDWGNSKRREGVCWRCGRSGHVAQNCVADMPADVKEHVLNHHAHFTTSESDDIAHAHLATDKINSATLAPTVLSQDQLTHFAPNDPLVLTLSANHQAHTAIDSAWRVFRPDEDVPLEF